MSDEARAPTVVLITDPAWPLAHVARTIEGAAEALARGRLLVQLRDKAAEPRRLADGARALRAVTRRVGAPLVVNAATPEALRIAIDSGADGAHVPCRALAAARGVLGARAWISVPAHSDDDVERALGEGATAALVSPIWSTPGKGPPRGVGALASARALAGRALRVYALGGVDASRVDACAEAGADGVAVIRALLAAADPAIVARRLDAAFDGREAGRRSSPA